MNTTPILPGFHPDPSICRVGEDYYLVTSTFEYLPGVPIFHSRDLVTWEQIGNILERDDQLVLPTSSAGGIFAPTLRHHDGRFWMITTNIGDVMRGHLIVSATNPAGPWSSAQHIAGAVGIDPDLFWDMDGTCHLTWKAMGTPLPIMQAQVDLDTATLLSSPRGISGGSGLAHPEGPHVYRRGDWHYLVLAEGGTERGHAVTVARSRTVDGPYEQHPGGPILSHRSTEHPVQNTGHADFVETADGDWAMVHLGVRPVGPSPGFHVLGRETFLAGVTWANDWPVVEDAVYPVPDVSRDFSDDFSEQPLDPRWISPGQHPRDFTAIDPGGGVRLAAPPPESEAEYRSLLAHRVAGPNWEARAEVERGAARLVLRLDDAHWAAVESHASRVDARLVVGPMDQTLGSGPASGEPTTTLVIRTSQPVQAPFGQVQVADRVELGFLDGDEVRILATFDGRYLSTEVAGGFTGRVVGVEPLPGADAALLRRVSYRHI